MRAVLRYIWAELSKSENPRGWFAYGASHLAHIALGAGSAAAAFVAAFYVLGEFPHKLPVAAALAVFWGCYEWVTQRRQDVWGNLEDWVFLCLYGAFPVVFLFDEKTIGEPHVMLDVTAVLPIVAVPVAHLVVGISIRIYRGMRG